MERDSLVERYSSNTRSRLLVCGKYKHGTVCVTLNSIRLTMRDEFVLAAATRSHALTPLQIPEALEDNYSISIDH